MSDFGTLKEVVLGCVTRAGSSFQTGGTNMVGVAINNAIIYAQRKANLEWCKGTVSIDCNPNGSIMVAKDENGFPVFVKNIIKSFGLVQPTGHKDVSVPYLSRVSQIIESTQERELYRSQRDCTTPNQSWVLMNANIARFGPCVIHQGQKIYCTPQPPTLPYTLWFEAVKWLPRLVNDLDTNFLLVYGFDFLMYRSIIELNFFIKEDERFQVNAKILDDAWSSFIQWDSSLVSPTETEIDF